MEQVARIEQELSPAQPERGDVPGWLPTWDSCRFLTCSVLPVASACNLQCPFCFSRSSISTQRRDHGDWRHLHVAGYYQFARERGATRLVITGGGEPLLDADTVVKLVRMGTSFFSEIACFTNGTYLTLERTQQLRDAGLSYICYSRHSAHDGENERLMGPGAPSLADFFAAAHGLKVRATCVMCRGSVDSPEKVWNYINTLRGYGVTEFTFKHTYVAYEHSVFRDSPQNHWARAHQVEFDPFADQGGVIARLPWGPFIRQLAGVQVCYYHEPTPHWERTHQLCRSCNLMADGTIYASLEDQRSRLYLPPT